MAETGAPDATAAASGTTFGSRRRSPVERPAPDFSALALEHLEQRCDAFRQHVREHLERPAAEAPLRLLVDDLQRFRNTLVMLERTGAVFVAEELLALLEARTLGRAEDQEAFAQVLVGAGERLGDHVARLRGGASGESALSLLPLVNDSRACRDAPLLSEALLLAAGIVVPTSLAADPDDSDADAAADARDEFLVSARELHPLLASDLLDWFHAEPPLGGSAAEVPDAAIDALGELSRRCDAPALAHLEALFEAAGVLLEALRDGHLPDGTAPRRLFGQLEAWLHRAGMRGELDSPHELYRNLLYYVALLEPTRPRVASLHHRFELGRIRPALEAAERDGAGTALGVRLSGAIRDSLDVETSGLRQWLDQAPTAADHPHVLRLRERLAHMEPVLTLLGARDARSWLRRINETLGTLSTDAPVGAAERLMLAESLIRLDRALDTAAGEPTGRRTSSAPAGAPAVAFDGHRADDEGRHSAERQALDEAVSGCLQEARRRLLSVGESLDAPRLVGSAAGDADLMIVERALTVLALPDIGPLLRGLRAANARIDAGSPPVLRATLATLIASLEFYLGCVLQEGEGSRRLLHDAEESLARLEARLPPMTVPGVAAPLSGGASRQSRDIAGQAATTEPPAHDPSPAPASRSPPGMPSEARGHAPEADETAAHESSEGGDLTREAIACMDAIGDALDASRENGVSVAALRESFGALAGIGARGGLDGLHRLATAAGRLLELTALARGGDAARLSVNELELLEEAHAVLPQLIDQVHGTSEKVRGLDALVQDLHGVEPEPVRSITGDAAAEDPDSDALDDSDALTLDNTLQQVFRRECAMHIDTLGQSVSAARRDRSARLPSDLMLRALHTLSGSAQTVDAQYIVAVVQPMQRAALARQRTGLPFDESETSYVGELIEVLRARLDALESGEPVEPWVLEVESRLPAFVAASLVGRDGAGERVRPDTRSLDSVFDEEAQELLVRLQRAIASENDAASGTDRALAHLHTLKGSARMAGRVAVAERAHALEGLVQGMPSSEARRRALATGRRELQALLLDGALHDTDRPVPAAPASRPSSPTGEPAEPADESMHADAAVHAGAPFAPPEASATLGPAAPAVAEASEALSEAHDAASVPAATFESLLRLATDVTVSQARLSDDIARAREICRDLESAAGRWRRLPHEAPLLESPAAREMLADLDTARRGLSDALRLADVEQQHASRAASSLQQTLIRTRLVKVEDLRERLDRAVRDAADATGRRARLLVEGGDVTLDGALCRQLRAPLEHLVRNAVVHGIEPADVRLGAGKDEVGTVRLSAAIDGTEIVLGVDDDGAGIDREAVSRRREAGGHAAVETVDALQEVLCETGFTTLDEASVVGGRGLGLAAVSETLTRLDGRLHIGTRTGIGTTVTCRLRQRIIVNQVVLVRCARRLYALPVNVVRRVGADDGGVAGKGAESIEGGIGESPRLSLLSLLGGAPPSSHRAEENEIDDTGAYVDGSAELSVEVGGRTFVLEVDRVLGYRELLTQPLGPQLAALQRYAGGSVLPDGRQVLLVELDRLVDEGRPKAGAVATRVRPDPETMRPLALVVDDSITMRVAAAGMLERHGVETREARDGIEALDSLARALPDLMIVDIDMPRLGGFDLIRRMRERHGERAPPVVVISSRDGEADRERAGMLGVVRYLSKPYTEQELHEALLASGLRLPDLTIA